MLTLELSLYDEDTPAKPGTEGLQLFVFLFCAELELLTPICAELEFHAPRFCAELELPAPRFYAELELPAPRELFSPRKNTPCKFIGYTIFAQLCLYRIIQYIPNHMIKVCFISNESIPILTSPKLF